MLFTSQVIASASGSVGGLTASRNRSGPYFRARVNPVQPGTVFQQFIKSAFNILTTVWKDLPQAARDAWDLYAVNTPTVNRLGQQIFLTGANMLVRNNVARFQAGLALELDAPTVFGMAALTPPTFTALPPNFINVSFDNTDSWAIETDGALLVYVGRPFSASRNFFKGPYRFAGTVLGDDTTPPTSPAAIPSPFVMTEGQKVGIRYVAVQADSRISPQVRDSEIVGA